MFLYQGGQLHGLAGGCDGRRSLNLSQIQNANLNRWRMWRRKKTFLVNVFGKTKSIDFTNKVKLLFSKLKSCLCICSGVVYSFSWSYKSNELPNPAKAVARQTQEDAHCTIFCSRSASNYPWQWASWQIAVWLQPEHIVNCTAKNKSFLAVPLRPLRYWLHFWQLRTTISTFIVALQLTLSGAGGGEKR